MNPNAYKHMREEKVLPVLSKVVELMTLNHKPSKMSRGPSYEEIAYKWLNLMPIKVLSKSHFSDRCDVNEIQLPLNELRLSFYYRYRINGTLYYWFDWFSKNLPLWMITKPGYQGQNSIGIPTYNLIDTLIDIDVDVFVDAFHLEYNPELHTLDSVNIDVDNLTHYINAKIRKIKDFQVTNEKTAKLYKAMELKLAKAILIKKQAQGFNSKITDPRTGTVYHELPQTYTVKLSGRRYYTGSNAIQRQSKDLRGAALGPCWETDLNVSVYSFYKWLGDQFKIDTSVLTELINDKHRFRQTLADCIQDSNMTAHFKLKKIKEGMQAIGFGCDPDNPRGALNYHWIHSGTDRSRVKQHPHFLGLQQVYKTILKHVKVEYAKERAEYKAKSGNPYWTSFMAYLYQSYETVVITALKDYCDSHDRDVLLWVHDGVYTRLRPDVPSLNTLLTEINPYARLDISYIDRWKANSQMDSTRQELEHQQRMAEQERIAQIKYSGSSKHYSEDEDVALAQILKEQGYML